VRYGGYDRSGGYDDVLISLYQKNADNSANGDSNLGLQSDTDWICRSGMARLNQYTTKLTFQVKGEHKEGTNNNTYFDMGHLIIYESDIWNWGNNSHDHFGTGDWDLASNDLRIGDNGIGGMHITNGAAVSNGNGNVGYGSGSNGTVTVDGAGSSWINSNDLNVGKSGTGTLNITNGAAVSNIDGNVGYNPGSKGTVTVDGAGSSWTNSNHLYVGKNGTGTLNITNGAVVSNNDGNVGYYWSSKGTVTVDGVGSSWCNSNDLYVSYIWSGTLNVNNGGIVSNIDGFVGYDTGSNGTVTVDGVGSGWTNSESIYVGGSSTNAGGTGTLNIFNKGRVEVAGTLKIWDQGQVNLDGGELRVSALPTGPGVFNWTSGRLALTESGVIENTILGSNKIFEIGQNAKLTMQAGTSFVSTGGELDFGANSELEITGGLLNHVFHQLNLAQGGRITGRGQIFTGEEGLNLGQGGSLIGTETGLKLWGDLYGSGSVSNTTILGDVYVGNSPGTIEMTDVDLSGSTLYMELAGNGLAGIDYDRIIFNGDIDLTGIVLKIILSDGFTPELDDTFALFDFGNALVSGRFADILLPGLDSGLFWNTDELYNLGSLEVSSTVPLPSAIWLFGSALIGLVGVRRKFEK